jgi:hypothetical protein
VSSKGEASVELALRCVEERLVALPAGVYVLVLEAGDRSGAPVPCPQLKEGRLGRAARATPWTSAAGIGCRAGQPHQVGGEVAVVGAAALLGPVDQLHEPVRELAPRTAPAVVALHGEEPRPTAGVFHQRGEALLRSGVALGVDHEHAPVGRARNAVGYPEQRLRLAGSGGADHERRHSQPPERQLGPATPHRQQLVARDGPAEAEARLPPRWPWDADLPPCAPLHPPLAALGASLVARVQFLNRLRAHDLSGAGDRWRKRQCQQPPRPHVWPRRGEGSLRIADQADAARGLEAGAHNAPGRCPRARLPPRVRAARRPPPSPVACVPVA